MDEQNREPSPEAILAAETSQIAELIDSLISSTQSGNQFSAGGTYRDAQGKDWAYNLILKRFSLALSALLRSQAGEEARINRFDFSRPKVDSPWTFRLERRAEHGLGVEARLGILKQVLLEQKEKQASL